MAVTIRMRQQGHRNQRMFRLVVADSRSPRDGKYLEMVGWYNPRGTSDEDQFALQADRIQHWLEQGAELSERVEALVERGAPGVAQWLRQRREARRLEKKAGQKQRRVRAAAA
jgi:small subunit ribosomal protein S16